MAKELNEDGDLDEQHEEEKFLASVAESICKLGKWSLQLYQNHIQILAGENAEEYQKGYLTILDTLLNKALELFDCDKPDIGRPLLEFYTHWVGAHSKLDALPEEVGQRMMALLDIVGRRIAYPNWCSLENLVSEEAEERETEYKIYREELTVLFNKLALIKPLQ